MQRRNVAIGKHWKYIDQTSDELKTNWQDAISIVLKTSKHLPFQKPDYLIFITDGNPNTRNDLSSFAQSNISSALQQAYEYVYGSFKYNENNTTQQNENDDDDDDSKNNLKEEELSDIEEKYFNNERKKRVEIKTKLIPIGIGMQIKEEYIRALTTLKNPQIGQDYFIIKKYDQLQQSLEILLENEVCCKEQRDECNICFNSQIFLENEKSFTENSISK